MKQNHFIIISLSIMFLGGFFIGWYIHNNPDHVTYAEAVRENSSQYRFINPLLLSADTIDQSPEYKPLDVVLTKYINTMINSKNAEGVSIYFRDMNSGQWTGVNENDMYSPASMLKIVTLIACLRLAETNPNLLDKRVAMSAQSTDLNVGEFYPPKNPIVPGQTYTIRELLSSMMVDSDNNAQALLLDVINDDQFKKVLSDLQLPFNQSASVNFLSPKQYSRLYRILYNSSYLSPQVSEETLKFLTQQDFPEGLYAGVPENIQVAQKFGERTITDTAGNSIDHELHDCGIIYRPNNPYFLCVMTKGQDFTKLQSIIAEVSKIVWDQISATSLPTAQK